MSPLESFEIDYSSGLPVWIQVKNRIAYLIGSGAYVPGDRLPTVRALAADLNVNYHTVNKVYTSLERDGYISSKRGRGAFVEKKVGGEDEACSSGDAVLADAVRQCVELGMTLEDVERHFAGVLKAFSADDV